MSTPEGFNPVTVRKRQAKKATSERYHRQKSEYMETKKCTICGKDYFQSNLLIVRKDPQASRPRGIWTKSWDSIHKIMKNSIILCMECHVRDRWRKALKKRYGNSEGHGSHNKYLKGCNCKACAVAFKRITRERNLRRRDKGGKLR